MDKSPICLIFRIQFVLTFLFHSYFFLLNFLLEILLRFFLELVLLLLAWPFALILVWFASQIQLYT